MKTIQDYLIEKGITDGELNLIKKEIDFDLSNGVEVYEDFIEGYGNEETFYDEVLSMKNSYMGAYETMEDVMNFFNTECRDGGQEYNEEDILSHYHYGSNGNLFDGTKSIY